MVDVQTNDFNGFAQDQTRKSAFSACSKAQDVKMLPTISLFLMNSLRVLKVIAAEKVKL